ncbi:hypothetical protein AVEN_81102-1 [Araneus ventricosus]|uniref:Uncharacterized protein n=1 Tax=Araneus ventricosus TaxID=182803 RepID=A0A4Y2DWZ5_ARAVE|nr:hypothetical protein AVEN_81102-1 [Araneus ventricosus]
MDVLGVYSGTPGWVGFRPLTTELNPTGGTRIDPLNDGLVFTSVRHENSARLVVSLTAVAIETSYRRRNPFRGGRSSGMMYSFYCPKLCVCCLPSDFSFSKWIFPNITSCYNDRGQRDNLAGRVLAADR